ncbi:MAG: FAD-dependent monooxygenase [Marinoscillum sp.]
MNKRHTSFLILGGGIAGLTCAIALRKNNIESIVADAALDFKPTGAGISLAANALKAYRHLGIDAIIMKAANELKQVDILDDKGKRISSTQTREIGDGTPSIALHRGTLHQVLLDQLSRENVLNGYKAKAIVRNEKGYLITFTNGEEITTDYLIAADGIHSLARTHVSPRSILRYSGHSCWRGVTTNDNDLPQYIASESWGAAGRVGLVPIDGNRIYWFVVKNAPAGSEQMRKYTREDLLLDFGHFHAPVGKVIAKTDQKDIIHHDIYDLKPIGRFADKNMVLIGDAGHATTPNMGQGACQAIEDAVILAQCIKNHSVMADAFKEYEQLRIKRVHMIVNQSWTMGKVGQLENPLLIGMRNLLFRSLPSGIMKNQLEKIYDFKLN